MMTKCDPEMWGRVCITETTQIGLEIIVSRDPIFLKNVKTNAMGGLLIPIFVRLKGPERILVVLGALEKPHFMSTQK